MILLIIIIIGRWVVVLVVMVGRIMKRCMYLLRDDKVDINVGMNEVEISASPDRSLDSHQAVLLRVLKYRVRFQEFHISRIFLVRLYPTDVLAATESPLTKTLERTFWIRWNQNYSYIKMLLFQYHSSHIAGSKFFFLFLGTWDKASKFSVRIVTLRSNKRKA